MKTHAGYVELQTWMSVPGISGTLEPEYLVEVRFELVTGDGVDCGRIDLVFQRAEQTAVLPAVLVDLAAAAKNAGGWHWPLAARILGDERADALVELVAPWLVRLTQEPVIPLEAKLRVARDRSAQLGTSALR